MLSTVGYGDLSPSTDRGKIFIMFHILTGVGVLVGCVPLVAQHFLSPRARIDDASEGRPDRPWAASGPGADVPDTGTSVPGPGRHCREPVPVRGHVLGFGRPA